MFLNWIQLSLLTQQQHDAHVDEHHLVPVLAGHQQVHVPQDQGGQLQHKNNPVRVDELGIFLRDEQNIKKNTQQTNWANWVKIDGDDDDDRRLWLTLNTPTTRMTLAMIQAAPSMSIGMPEKRKLYPVGRRPTNKKKKKLNFHNFS